MLHGTSNGSHWMQRVGRAAPTHQSGRWNPRDVGSHQWKHRCRGRHRSLRFRSRRSDHLDGIDDQGFGFRRSIVNRRASLAKVNGRLVMLGRDQGIVRGREQRVGVRGRRIPLGQRRPFRLVYREVLVVDRGPRSQRKLLVVPRHQWRWLLQIFWNRNVV